MGCQIAEKCRMKQYSKVLPDRDSFVTIIYFYLINFLNVIWKNHIVKKRISEFYDLLGFKCSADHWAESEVIKKHFNQDDHMLNLNNR